MDLKFLWVQGALRAGRVSLDKELGETNFADLMTKHLGLAKLQDLLERSGFVFCEGRAPGAPALAGGGAAEDRGHAIMGCAVLGMGSH